MPSATAALYSASVEATRRRLAVSGVTGAPQGRVGRRTLLSSPLLLYSTLPHKHTYTRTQVVVVLVEHLVEEEAVLKALPAKRRPPHRVTGTLLPSPTVRPGGGTHAVHALAVERDHGVCGVAENDRALGVVRRALRGANRKV